MAQQFTTLVWTHKGEGYGLTDVILIDANKNKSQATSQDVGSYSNANKNESPRRCVCVQQPLKDAGRKRKQRKNTSQRTLAVIIAGSMDVTSSIASLETIMLPAIIKEAWTSGR